MVELKINTKYRVMGLPENVGRIENGDIVETTDIVQNLPFVGVVWITHPESAWIKKTFLFEMEKKPNDALRGAEPASSAERPLEGTVMQYIGG